MGLDEAGQFCVTQLLRQNRGADRLGAELGDGEACGEGERRPADTKQSLSGSETEPQGAEQELCRHSRARLVGKAK
jgi:hypothetical protein